MPERPDLDYVVPRLDAALRGAIIVGTRVKKPVVLRITEPILGTITRVTRRAHYVLFDLTQADKASHVLAISPMLAGRFDLVVAAGGRLPRDPADLAVALLLSDGRELRYRDEVQMGKVYLVPAGQVVPGLETVGVDVLSPAFTLDRLRALAKGRRDQVKLFLMDKTALDAMGNAYADEVLWAAGLHPKRPVRTLSEEELGRLHAAIIQVIAESSATIEARQPALYEKVRDFLHVRGRAGEACDRCGTKLRTVGVLGHDAFFCPKCQPDTLGRGFVDWRKTM